MGNEASKADAPSSLNDESLKQRGITKLDQEMKHKLSKGAHYNSALS